MILRRAAALAVLMIAATGCGSDDPETTASVEMNLTLDAAQPSNDDMDMSHDDDMADGDHEHSADTLVEWPAGRDNPEIVLITEPGDDGSVIATFELTGFTVVGGDSENVAEGAGHLHVSVDGHSLGMAFEPEMTLEALEPGPHVLAVDLSSGTHDLYASNGELMRYTASFEVPGDIADADEVIEFTVDEGGIRGGIVEGSASIGDLIELRVDSEIAEELHVHAYDVSVELVPGETAVLRFSAEIPGVFEVELEGSGLQVGSLKVEAS